MSPLRKIRVLVVDDSAVARGAISAALRADPDLEIVGGAADPYVANRMIAELKPDVFTLDIEMPRMNGITFLRLLQQHHPLPVVIISSIAQRQSDAALQALEAGAVEVLAKPASSTAIGELAQQLPRCVKAAAASRRQVLAPNTAERAAVPVRAARTAYDPRQVVVLGASTGGVRALGIVLEGLPAGLPGICIAQHIPAGFSRAFADRLNGRCQYEVREAEHGDLVLPGQVLVAPGDEHMSLRWVGGRYRVALDSSAPVNFVRPSIDVLFESAAECAGRHAVAALLTGMGRDGAQGLKRLREAGAHTLAEAEETCVVFGMPRAAQELGAAERMLPLGEIAAGLVGGLETIPCPRISKP